jgi:hypothetical protein
MKAALAPRWPIKTSGPEGDERHKITVAASRIAVLSIE